MLGKVTYQRGLRGIFVFPFRLVEVSLGDGVLGLGLGRQREWCYGRWKERTSQTYKWEIATTCNLGEGSPGLEKGLERKHVQTPLCIDKKISPMGHGPKC